VAKDALALVLLLGVMVLGLIGMALYISGSNRRAALASRSRDDTGRSAYRASVERLDQMLRRTRQGQRLSQWLRASGGPLSPVDAVAIVLIGGLLLGFLLLALLPPFFAFLVAYAMVVGGLRWYVERARNKRRDAFMDQLPDLARMLSNGTQAGLSIPGAVQMAARELDDPAGAEMAAVVQEMRIGQPLDRALERLQERLPSREVAVLMTTIVIQQRAGGDTVRALSELSTTLEARKDLQREIRTLLAGAVFNSYIVAAMGAGSLLLVNGIQPGLLRKMASTTIGIAALAIAAALWTTGFVAVRRITRVDA
jgi:tight adherence protein B